mmetsp:Transcript_27061/g.43495  ORF Transcript_27061/g.43495 Transcript_27061/m.43495 type:complete len:224 (+) Transcript_27061:847-1518(+)
MYVSPADRIGLTAHHDPQDVFILQLSGSKIWKVCHPIGGGVELPTRVSDDPSHPLYYRYTDEKLEKEGAKCESFTLREKDVLYMPRGTIHAPRTTASNHSVHLTIGIDGDFTWGDFLKGVRRTGGLKSNDALAAYFDCLPGRSLNMLVPHRALQGVPPHSVPKALVEQYQDELSSLRWGKCDDDRLNDIKNCADCIQNTISLMRQLQIRKAQQDEVKRRNIWK